jgi:opacity protein-like surface antigen
MNFRPVAAAVLGFAVSLIATSFQANAADIIKPVVVVPPSNPFDGFYIGGHVGYGAATRSGCTTIFSGVRTDEGFADCEDPDTTFDYDQNGWLIGSQVGINRTFNEWGHSWVLGAEVSGDLSGITGNLGEQFPGYSGTGDWNWLALGLAKIGWTSGHWMLYADAGVALGSFSFNAAACNFTSNNQGWAAGLGVEWATTYNNSWFLDWQRIGFDDKDAHCNDSVPTGGFDTAVNTSPDIDIVRFGFNHHFK